MPLFSNDGPLLLPTFPVLPGLLAHWRADVGVTVDGSNNVLKVLDQSNQGNHLINSGTVVLDPVGYFNKPTFVFSASGSLVCSNIASFGSGNELSVFVVGTGFRAGIGGTAAGSGLVCYATADNVDSNSASGFAWRETAAGTALELVQQNNTVGPLPYFFARMRVGFTMQGGGTNNILYINAVNSVSGSLPSMSLASGGRMVVGDRASVGSPVPWLGTMSEIVVCSQAITQTDVTNLDNWFTGLWGI